MKRAIALILISASLILCLSGCINDVLGDVFSPEESENVENPLPEEMPEDFSFYVEWDYAHSSYDSASGELRKKSGEKFVTEYIMSKEELNTVYNIIRGINPGKYNDKFDKQELGMANPFMTVSLVIHAGEYVKEITAEQVSGFTGGKSPLAKAYFEAVATIVDILQASEAWKSLPPDTNWYY